MRRQFAGACQFPVSAQRQPERSRATVGRTPAFRPTLPRASRVTEVDRDVSGQRKTSVICHLLAAVPSQRLVQLGLPQRRERSLLARSGSMPIAIGAARLGVSRPTPPRCVGSTNGIGQRPGDLVKRLTLPPMLPDEGPLAGRVANHLIRAQQYCRSLQLQCSVHGEVARLPPRNRQLTRTTGPPILKLV
jgi:hypothetical protein